MQIVQLQAGVGVFCDKRNCSLWSCILHEAVSFAPDTSREFIQSPSNDPFVEEAMALPGFKESVDELHKQLEELRQKHATETRPRYPEVVFFGTGSAMPNKERNVAGILLNLRSVSKVMCEYYFFILI